MIPPAMQKVLAALTNGCYLEWQKVSKAENPRGQRLFIVDPHSNRRDTVDPRTARALAQKGYIMHPYAPGYRDDENRERWVLTHLGDLEYKAELGRQ